MGAKANNGDIVNNGRRDTGRGIPPNSPIPGTKRAAIQKRADSSNRPTEQRKKRAIQKRADSSNRPTEQRKKRAIQKRADSKRDQERR
jgi:hypothetical protein